LLLACGCPAGTPGPAEPPPAAPLTDRLAALEPWIEQALVDWQVPGLALAVVRRDAVLLSRGYGERRLGSAEPVDGATSFAIASLTKAFTATTLGLLVADGTLGWDDRVVDRLPGFALHDPALAAELRLRDLLSHRAGYETFAGDLLWIGSRFDSAEVLRRAADLEPSWGVRYQYGYSNLMFLAAGAVLEHAAGRSWAALLRERLLGPLGMSRTTTSVAELDGLDNVAVPYMEVDGELLEIPYLPVDNMQPAAALNSCADDLARWLRLQLGDGTLDGQPIVPPEVLAETRAPHTAIPLGPLGRSLIPERHLLSYALGWAVWDYRGRLVVSHEGGLPGMFSYVAFVPEADVGVAVLTNAEQSLTRAVVMQVLDLALDAPPRDWSLALREWEQSLEQPATPGTEPTAVDAAPAGPSLPLSAYAGAYHNPLLGRAELVESPDGLHLALPDHGGLDGTLAPAAGEAFECRWSDPSFGTSIVELDVEQGRAVRLRFQVRPDFIDPLVYEFTRTDDD
jgi:CubicO group peptidase (beta-lactamase class C family)